MSKTIIPSSNPKNPNQNPGKNNVFVGSRSGGPAEQSRTKTASIKHENPEYFKRQSDRKNDSPLMGRATPESRAAALALARQPNPALERKRKEAEFENRALAREAKGGQAYSRGNNPYSKDGKKK